MTKHTRTKTIKEGREKHVQKQMTKHPPDKIKNNIDQRTKKICNKQQQVPPNKVNKKRTEQK